MSKKRIKQYLMLLTVVGLVSIAAGGSGTFASFDAETTNANNVIQTGTLFLHDNGGTTTCTSETAANNHLNAGCDTLFQNVTLNPGNGTPTTIAHLTLTNAGSIDASDIKFNDNGTACSNGTPTLMTIGAAGGTSGSTTLTVSGLGQALVVGTPISIAGDATAYKVNAAAASGATSVTITPALTQTDNNAVVTLNTTGIGAATTLCGQLLFNVVEMTDNTFSAASSCAFGPANCQSVFPGGAAQFATALSGISASPAFTALTIPGALNGNAANKLTAGKSRFFVVQVYAPVGLGNTAQNQKATFNLNWHIDQ
jgi:hypothetical protein